MAGRTDTLKAQQKREFCGRKFKGGMKGKAERWQNQTLKTEKLSKKNFIKI